MPKSLFSPVMTLFLLAGCAGTNSEFECQATTSDSCITMQQANEQAKTTEVPEAGEPVVGTLPDQAEKDACVCPMAPSSLTPADGQTFHDSGSLPVLMHQANPPGHRAPSPARTDRLPHPYRAGEQLTALWIAPYIDASDVYHQPAEVLFVGATPHWTAVGSDGREK